MAPSRNAISIAIFSSDNQRDRALIYGTTCKMTCRLSAVILSGHYVLPLCPATLSGHFVRVIWPARVARSQTLSGHCVRPFYPAILFGHFVPQCRHEKYKHSAIPTQLTCAVHGDCYLFFHPARPQSCYGKSFAVILQLIPTPQYVFATSQHPHPTPHVFFETYPQTFLARKCSTL